MFVRWRSRKLDKAKAYDTKTVSRRTRRIVYWRPSDDSEYRQDVSWSAEVVTCRRIGGKPRQLHLESFGPITEGQIATNEWDRRDFWRHVERRLARWHPTPAEMSKLLADIECKVPRPGPSVAEQRARRFVEAISSGA